MLRIGLIKLVALLTLVMWGALCPAPVIAQRVKTDARLEKFQDQRVELYDRFFKQVDQLIEFADTRGLTDAVSELKTWKTPVSGSELLASSLPQEVQPQLPKDFSDDEKQWRVEFHAAKQAIAKELYLLSRRVLNANFHSIAISLVREVLYFDPDHEQARTQLGYERFGELWTTPFSARKLKSGFIWHDQFGWLPQTHKARYEKGERCYRTNWMTAAREASIRQDFSNAWEVETDHYRVKTNVSLERGVEIAKALEVFHKYFRSTFDGFFNSPEQLKKAAKPSRPFEIHFFRTQDEYVNRLKKNNPQIGITNGIYMPDDRVAYFYESPEGDVESTLYHEATHQILYELHSQPRQIGQHDHFWVVEGIACYMESFRRKEGGFSIGDPAYIRFQNARDRAIGEGYLVPLARFSEMGKLAFQADPNIKKNYSQAAGLAHFFMHFGDGRYRDALVQHLELLYRPQSGRVRIAGLNQLTGASYDELDRQYIEHMRSLSLEAASAANP